ncbi:hypothetical protein B0H14DRAFT_3158386 [Mycena olivaceomarginata]|nr:hypothetical protein B0H14DRAFT_3158386 [Mycena olivaceomarginata]
MKGQAGSSYVWGAAIFRAGLDENYLNSEAPMPLWSRRCISDQSELDIVATLSSPLSPFLSAAIQLHAFVDSHVSPSFEPLFFLQVPLLPWGSTTSTSRVVEIHGMVALTENSVNFYFRTDRASIHSDWPSQPVIPAPSLMQSLHGIMNWRSAAIHCLLPDLKIQARHRRCLWRSKGRAPLAKAISSSVGSVSWPSVIGVPHRTVYGYGRKNYGYIRVLTVPYESLDPPDAPQLVVARRVCTGRRYVQGIHQLRYSDPVEDCIRCPSTSKHHNIDTQDSRTQQINLYVQGIHQLRYSEPAEDSGTQHEPTLNLRLFAVKAIRNKFDSRTQQINLYVQGIHQLRYSEPAEEPNTRPHSIYTCLQC